MKRAAFAIAAAIPFCLAAPAEAFDPFRDYHLHGRVEFERKVRPNPAPGSRPKPGPAASAVPFWASTPDDDDAPQAKPKLQAGLPLLQGGPRPSISAETPPTVSHALSFAPGSVVIDTKGRQLLYILSSSQAYRYPISVGREGFTWTGTQKISRVADWPDWRPPAEMRQRDPRLPELMTGGINNPLGARALYLGSSLYRIHGTNDARTIGYAASSGCFRMRNAHVMHLSQHARVGTTVHVLSSLPSGGGKRKVAAGKPGTPG